MMPNALMPSLVMSGLAASILLTPTATLDAPHAVARFDLAPDPAALAATPLLQSPTRRQWQPSLSDKAASAPSIDRLVERDPGTRRTRRVAVGVQFSMTSDGDTLDREFGAAGPLGRALVRLFDSRD